MLNEERAERGRWGSWFLGAAAGALMITASFGVQGAVSDHRVERAEVDKMAARIEQRDGFPMLVDERVVTRLNDWVAVPSGRRYMKAAMERMPRYRGMIEKSLGAHHMPVELLGVAMAESGFYNDAHPDSPAERRPLGIWQIMPSTGRKLGLEVSERADDRLDPQKATEAATALLGGLFARYHDWPIAIAAYNAGEDKVDALIAGAASAADACARVLAGDEEHARYVRPVMASVVLIDNPSLLE